MIDPRGSEAGCTVPVSLFRLARSGVSPFLPSLPSSQLPVFAPRDTFIKLSLNGNPSMDTKLRWLSDVSRTFNLQRKLTEVKMAAVTWFIYISGKCRFTQDGSPIICTVVV